MSRKIRILVAKPGLDGHDRGARAVQEDVDLIGMSSLAAAHVHHFSRVLELLKDQGAEDIKVIAGGIIPDLDIEKLKAMGVEEIFVPGTPLGEIVQWVHDHIRPR